MPAVSITTNSAELIPVNYNRTALMITNSDSTNNLHVVFGGTATTNDAYIPPGGNMTLAGDRIWKGAINAIASAGTITAKYSEASPGT